MRRGTQATCCRLSEPSNSTFIACATALSEACLYDSVAWLCFGCYSGYPTAQTGRIGSDSSPAVERAAPLSSRDAQSPPHSIRLALLQPLRFFHLVHTSAKFLSLARGLIRSACYLLTDYRPPPTPLMMMKLRDLPWRAIRSLPSRPCHSAVSPALFPLVWFFASRPWICSFF